MALTSAEKQRRYRERQKAKARAARAKPSPGPIAFGQSFSEFLRERSTRLQFLEGLDWVGVDVRGNLEDDNNPVGRPDEWADEGIEVTTLNRAAAMVDTFIDAAKELSDLINEYKLADIERQLAKRPNAARRALLESMKQKLSRRTSHFFAAI